MKLLRKFVFNPIGFWVDPFIRGVWFSVGAAVVGTATSVYGMAESSKAGKKQQQAAEVQADAAQDMADYNAGIADGHARQTLENAEYDIEFAEMATIAEVYLLEYEQQIKLNQAQWMDGVTKRIAEDGAVNQVRQRKQGLRFIAEQEANVVGSGAAVGGSSLIALAESVKNLEIDAHEIGRLSLVESGKAAQTAVDLRTEADLLGKRAEMTQVFGEMKEEGILRGAKQEAQDFKAEAERLRRHGRVDASNYLAQGQAYRSAGTSQAVQFGTQAVGSALSGYKAYKKI